MTNQHIGPPPVLYEEVFGGGGSKGISHAGYLDARESLGIRTGFATGVSVGALVAIMHKNGMTGKEIHKAFLARSNRYMDPMTLMMGIAWFDPLAFWTGSVFTLEKLMAQFVKDFGLKPQPDLRILAFDAINRKPVLFTGTDYDPVVALTASGAVPGFFRPIMQPDSRVLLGQAFERFASWMTSFGGFASVEAPSLRPEILVDGAMYHFNPTEFSKTTAIVSRLGRVRNMPSKALAPMDFAMHMRELTMHPSPHTYEIDTSQHVLVHTDLPNHGALVFGHSPADYQYMFDHARETAMRTLSDPNMLPAQTIDLSSSACMR